MIPNGVLCDTVHRPYKGILYCQNIIQFHKTHERVISFSSLENYSFHRTTQTHQSTAALSVHFLYHISTKLDNKCGKYGHQFIYSPK